MPRLLLIFAHPDDEAFGCAGTSMLNHQAGGETFLICATRGEEGEISDSALATPETLGSVRERELQRACERSGMEPPIFLGYRDSGMIGTAANARLDAYVNASDDEVVARLVAEIRRLRPDVVVTFDPSGIYGHPDHLTVHRQATRAFYAAGDTSAFPEAGVPYSPARLYYNTAAREDLLRFFEERRASNGTDDGFGGPQPGTPRDEITTIVDVSSVVDRKAAALAAHATQQPVNRDEKSGPPIDWLKNEHYLRVFPLLPAGARETSLFDGL